MSQKSIQLELFTNLDHNETFTIQDAYEKVTSTDKKHSIRARIYEAIDKGIFEKVSRGVYRFIDSNDNSTLLIKSDGRDLSKIHDNFEIPPFDNYIVDKTTNKLYKTQFGRHFETIMNIIQLHPELDTVEKQDDFVMSQLKLVGTTHEQNYYTPKDLVFHHNKSELKSFDYYKEFLNIYKKYLNK